MKNQHTISQFSERFLSSFYKDVQGSVILDNLLNRYTFSDVLDSKNHFKLDIGNVVFNKEGIKFNDYAKKYCSYVKAFQVTDNFESIFSSEKYTQLEDKIVTLYSELQDLQGQRFMKKIEFEENYKNKLAKTGKTAEEIKKSLDNENFSHKGLDAKIAATQRKIDMAENNKHVILKQVPDEVTMIFDALRKCDHALQTNIQTQHNMVTQQLGMNPVYAPQINSNPYFLDKLHGKLVRSDEKSSDISEKEVCRNNAKFKISLNQQDIWDLKANAKVQGSYLTFNGNIQVGGGKSDNSTTKGCISFEDIFKVSFSHSWLDTSIYKLNLKESTNLKIDSSIYLDDIRKDFCKVPTAAIIGLKAMVYINDASVTKSDLTIGVNAAKNFLFASINVGQDFTTQQEASNQAESLVAVDDSLVVLAYEYSDYCLATSFPKYDEL